MRQNWRCEIGTVGTSGTCARIAALPAAKDVSHGVLTNCQASGCHELLHIPANEHSSLPRVSVLSCSKCVRQSVTQYSREGQRVICPEDMSINGSVLGLTLEQADHSP